MGLAPSSLIRDHSVCYHDKSILACILNTCICSRHNKQTTFSGHKNDGRIRVNFQERKLSSKYQHGLTLCLVTNFYAFLSAADFFQNPTFLKKKVLSGIPSEC